MAFGVHQHKSGRVPELVAEVAITLAALDVEVNRTAERGRSGHREAQRVGAVRCDAVGKVFAHLRRDLRRVLGPAQAGAALGDEGVKVNAVDDVERVERVAFALRHFLAFGVTDHAVHVNVAKRNAAGEMHRHHDHPCYPEEKDVVTSYQHSGWQIRVVRGFVFDVRPAECRKRQHRR